MIRGQEYGVKWGIERIIEVLQAHNDFLLFSEISFLLYERPAIIIHKTVITIVLAWV